eukprot:1179956-Prorocentrum_minimum.AAC.7
MTTTRSIRRRSSGPEGTGGGGGTALAGEAAGVACPHQRYMSFAFAMPADAELDSSGAAAAVAAAVAGRGRGSPRAARTSGRRKSQLYSTNGSAASARKSNQNTGSPTPCSHPLRL